VGYHTFYETTRGRNGGVWAHQQVALAYAKWLSPAFHIYVNDCFIQFLKEEANPDLKVERATEIYAKQGMTPEQIVERVTGVAVRKSLTDEIQERQGNGWTYQNVTKELTKGALGMLPSELKAARGGKSGSARNYMTEEELRVIRFFEDMTLIEMRKSDAQGDKACLEAAKKVTARFGMTA